MPPSTVDAKSMTALLILLMIYLAAFQDESSFSAAAFVKQLVKAFPFTIECIQTDNGPEFT